MVADVRPGSSNLSALLKTVTGVKPKLYSKGTVGKQPGQKAERKVENGDEITTGSEPEEKMMIGCDFNSRYQFALRSMARWQPLLGRILSNKYSKK